ncbi:MAG: response regulator [Anaerolineae bacterium]|nr:response regulator [Anaerolineae bacterium]
MTKRILIIDDEPRWIEFIKRDLGGHEIVVAKDAKAALAELETGSFDLVIASSRRLDILESIRERFSDNRVVVMTVQPTTQEALAAYRLGAVRYCTKSFDAADLQVCVGGLIPIVNNIVQYSGATHQILLSPA